MFRFSLVLLLLVAACHRAPERAAASPPSATTDAVAPAASLTTFDWAPPCRVPVIELTREHDNDDTRRLRYVVEVTRGKDGMLEVRLRDFQLLEMNGEDMTTPEHAAQGPGLIVLDALRPVLHVGADGQVTDVGPIEADRVRGELELEPAQSEKLPHGSYPASPQIQDEMVERWRMWVSAWTPWALAAGQVHEGRASRSTRSSAAFSVVVRAEHLRGDKSRVELQVTDTLDAAAVTTKYAALIRYLLAHGLSHDDRYLGGDERTVLRVETDPATLRPQHASLEREGSLAMAESGPLPLGRVLDATFDWAHAEGCTR